MYNSKTLLSESGVKFGTSGARGLVSDFTPEVCAAFTHSFIAAIKDEFDFSKVAFGIDNRPSSPEMAQACIAAAQQLGLEPVYCGVLPTPALAYYAMQNDMPCIMITGSHIPFDRNGLKFYRPDGEITKEDELAILEQSVQFDVLPQVELLVNTQASKDYINRYKDIYPEDVLSRLKIGIYEHSSAGRDLYKSLFESLGAEVVCIGRSDEFVPIDTEAVSEQDKENARTWSKEFDLDAVFSTDGDGDRPLLSDENGEYLRGDILGLLCSKLLKVEALSVPVSCNSAIDLSGNFKKVSRTKIGSPYVIAEFDALSSEYSSVAGFEANGGYLLGSRIEVEGKIMEALPTRDALLPAIAVLAQAKSKPISAMLEELPARYTHSDRIQNFATAKSQAIIADATGKVQKLLDTFSITQAVKSTDLTDGLRVTLETGDIIHLRPSGNAPELRCYAESNSVDSAKDLVENALSKIVNYPI